MDKTKRNRVVPGRMTIERRGVPILLSFLLLALSAASWVQADSFVRARPVWPSGRSEEKNLQVIFRLAFSAPPTGAVLRVTGSTVYRARLNGHFLGYGPARAPHGFFRIDEWSLSPYLTPGQNVVTVEVAGYNVNSYYLLDQPSFLQAEIISSGKAVIATGDPEVAAVIPGERVQKVPRYSFQRPFTEVYTLTALAGPKSEEIVASLEPVACEVDTRPRRYLPRGLSYPAFELRDQLDVIGTGKASPISGPVTLWKDRAVRDIGPKLKGYPESELQAFPSIEIQHLRFELTNQSHYRLAEDRPLILGPNDYGILDLGVNLTGFIGAEVTCDEPVRLVFAFDEILLDKDVDFKRLGCTNLVVYELPAGRFSLESFEPYTLRYLKPIVLSGRCRVDRLFLREYACPGVEAASFQASDARLDRLFQAGRQTFRQNAVDLFTDCPSRERAGWLCDSFFTARVAPDLTGNTTIEQVMMEDFLLPAQFDFMPPGMLPMCYPADHNDGVFIANWAMWFVVQLEEYLTRSGDRETVDRFAPRVLALMTYLARFRNSDGLLEKLPSWVFIEWSDANRYVQDVNYPSNMLYASTLDTVARLYRQPQFAEQARELRQAIRRQSYDGQFFVDNALRGSDGKLHATRNHTEVCQYYAFFFGVATPQGYPDLWKRLSQEFGPGRRRTKAYPDVGFANSFVGNMLRLELLSANNLSAQILDESIDYLLYMADRTGTLWENVDDAASCNHGFASHIVHTLYRDVLGIRDIDAANRKLTLRFSRLPLEWCTGTRPTPSGPISLSWRLVGSRLEYSLETPPGWQVKIERTPGLKVYRAGG